MRVGDFGVEVVAHGEGHVRELESGHVLARPGQVYRLRLRNFGPLHGVAEVQLDGRRVTAGGLVLRPWSTTELERPIDGHDDGRFTVVAEGDESVFGPDGGRDNPALGLIDARFRRELPRHHGDAEPPPTLYRPLDRPFDGMPDRMPGRIPDRMPSPRIISAIAPARWPGSAFPGADRVTESIERAAGTGLTGHSDQRFEPAHLGPLETEATIIQLRLVIGSEAELAAAARSLDERHAPARPAARP